MNHKKPHSHPSHRDSSPRDASHRSFSPRETSSNNSYSNNYSPDDYNHLDSTQEELNIFSNQAASRSETSRGDASQGATSQGDTFQGNIPQGINQEDLNLQGSNSMHFNPYSAQSYNDLDTMDVSGNNPAMHGSQASAQYPQDPNAELDPAQQQILSKVRSKVAFKQKEGWGKYFLWVKPTFSKIWQKIKEVLTTLSLIFSKRLLPFIAKVFSKLYNFIFDLILLLCRTSVIIYRKIASLVAKSYSSCFAFYSEKAEHHQKLAYCFRIFSYLAFLALALYLFYLLGTYSLGY